MFVFLWSRSIDRWGHRIERWTLRIPFIELTQYHYLYICDSPRLGPSQFTCQKYPRWKYVTSLRCYGQQTPAPASHLHLLPSVIDKTIRNRKPISEFDPDKTCNKYFSWIPRVKNLINDWARRKWDSGDLRLHIGFSRSLARLRDSSMASLTFICRKILPPGKIKRRYGD